MSNQVARNESRRSALIFMLCLGLGLAVFGAGAAAQESPAPVHPSLKHLAKVMKPGDGVIRGKVSSADNGELLPAASIYVNDPKTGILVKGAPGSLDGDYEVVVPAGIYNVKVSYISYGDALYKGVTVKAGQPTKLDMMLKPEGVTSEEVVVEAKLLENTERALIARQQHSASVSDGISAEQISRTADSDAAEAVKRVTGVSVVGNKYVYVRGLGERYSSTQLNGARVTSTESKRVVALDIVPARLVDNVITQKTYSPDQWAEFAGGVVQINTKDFPDEFASELTLSLGLEPSSSLTDFETYPGGDLDWLGRDDGRRALPDLVQELASDRKVTRANFTPAELEQFGESFENVWDPATDRSLVNNGLAFSVGNKMPLFNRPLGFIGSLTYGRNYDNRSELEQSFTNDGSNILPYSSYDVERSSYGVDLGGILNFTYLATPSQKFSWRNTYTRNGEDEVREYAGFSPNYPDEPLRNQRLRFIERDMYATRVEGEHLVKGLGQSIFNWQVGYASSNRDEPDTREVAYKQDPVSKEYVLWDSGQTGMRFFSGMDDNDVTTEVKLGVPLPAWQWRSAKVDVGAFYSDRDREFLARRFRYVPKRQAGNPDSVDITLPAEEIYVPENISPTRFQLEEFTRNSDAYAAKQVIKGGFANGDFAIGSHFRLLAGIRVESSDQRLRTFEVGNPEAVPVEVKNAVVQPAPAVSFIYKANDITNVRLGYSRTVNRPDFRELAPFEYTEFIGGRSEIGNPDLGDAAIKSYDLRLERYPGLGEMQAVSFFYKDFEDPIEVIVLPGVSRIVSWANTESARNSGVELEYRQGLGRYLDALSAVQLGLNVALVDSKVNIGASPSVNTTRERALQGQSPFVINGNLGYAFPDNRTHASILYNVYGKRIASVGANGLPDIYERSRHQIDMSASTSFNHHMKIKFTAKDLLNHHYRFTQGGEVTTLYQPGRQFTLGFTYGL
jgi:outer membrane receptor for ferrienterochelin and colicin